MTTRGPPRPASWALIATLSMNTAVPSGPEVNTVLTPESIRSAASAP
ncbi:MAG: hypothetical protein RXP91_02950 [Nitrososphaeria archaeon]